MNTSYLKFLLIISVVAIACKKDNLQSERSSEKKWIVTTVAGEGSHAFADGPALSAKFGHPSDIAVAYDGAIYVTDLDNRRIRKISGGQVSTFAGNGETGIVNAVGLSAKFIAPLRMIFNGDLYISDAGDARIRKISPITAIVSTYAGTDLAGFKDGKADTAQFDFDMDMVTDPEGNIYIADPWNNRIRKINASGDVTTIAGGFDLGQQDPFRFPASITRDYDGNLYVADVLNYRIRKITPVGQISMFAGSGVKGFADGNAAIAQFYELNDLTIDGQGNLIVADYNRIRKITPQGVVSTLAGSVEPGYKDGDSILATFYYPHGLAIDVYGNIYVADTYNNRIRKISFE